ncbi:Annexin A11 [Aphelenchoides bicaudatus]|nr:Annexin A11 [Aphelenchoides bicaudatus]
MPPIEVSHVTNGNSIIHPNEGEKMIEADLPPTGYQRQKSTSSENERKARQRRLAMPLQYQRMYQSVSEDVRPSVIGQTEEDFRPEAASKALRTALSGIQSDDKTIIQILVSHTNFQRQKIANSYEVMYSRNLASDIEEEAGGYFLDATLALLQPAHVYSARILHRALSGRSSNRSIAVEIGLTNSVAQLKVIRDAYLSEYNISLEKDLSQKVEGLFGKMLQLILLRNSDPDDVDLESTDNFVSLLSKSEHGLEELGRNIELFQKVIANRGLNNMRAFVERYDQHITNTRNSNETISDNSKSRDFESVLRRSVNIHTEIKQLLLMYAKISRNMQLYFAEKLHDANSPGSSPDHASIIRILVTRSEIDLHDICDEYKKRYTKNVILDLQQTCSGEFLRLLNLLVNPSETSDDVFS